MVLATLAYLECRLLLVATFLRLAGKFLVGLGEQACPALVAAAILVACLAAYPASLVAS